ncbi:CGA synthase-related protein [Streptomyces sp. NPDC048710]|uniref:CGA synthase-related protein n=1 Tax=unclassified Streptomyces TaxID=2593676 RepID=UPI00372314E4
MVAGRTLDSQTAARRAAHHVTEMEVVRVTAEDPDQLRAAIAAHTVRAALVVDEPWATRTLRAEGIPALHLYADAAPTVVPVEADLRMAHRPTWYEDTADLSRGVTPVASFAPARRGWSGKRKGALVAFGTGTAGTADVLDAARRALLPLLPRLTEAAEGPCTVVCDGPVDELRALAADVTDTTVLDTADCDLDELHSGCGVFTATPTLAALTLARGRGAPLTLLPALDDIQQDLLDKVTKAVPVPVCTAPDAWTVPAGIDWAVSDSDDDLSGAQRVARKLRQLVLAPV